MKSGSNLEKVLAAGHFAVTGELGPPMSCDAQAVRDQADILGAAALGMKNCLCIAGDRQSFGAAGRLKGHPGAKNVYDIDSIQLANILKNMRDEGVHIQRIEWEEVVPEVVGGAGLLPRPDMGTDQAE